MAAQVTKARMDRNVAAGYDLTKEWANNSVLAGEDLTDLGDEEDDEEDVQTAGAEQDRHSTRAADDSADDGDLPDVIAEESDEVSSLMCRSWVFWFPQITDTLVAKSPQSSQHIWWLHINAWCLGRRSG